MAEKIAYLLPKQVVYWALVRAWAYATGGQWGGEDSTTITCQTVAVRWYNQRFSEGE